uniref:Venom cystatin 3 n=1 Tax=Oncocephalus sp. TaxID=2944721 RepID=A0AB38ZEL5_9HEMI
MALKAIFFMLATLVALHHVNASCPGCISDADVNDPNILRGVKQVLAQQNSNDMVIKIVSAKSQVVSGIRYIVEFLVKNPQTNETKLCKADYIEQPWESKNSIIKDFSCEVKN